MPVADIRPAPGLGAHTRDVCAELGLDDAEIDSLLASGAIELDVAMEHGASVPGRPRRSRGVWRRRAGDETTPAVTDPGVLEVGIGDSSGTATRRGKEPSTPQRQARAVPGDRLHPWRVLAQHVRQQPVRTTGRRRPSKGYATWNIEYRRVGTRAVAIRERWMTSPRRSMPSPVSMLPSISTGCSSSGTRRWTSRALGRSA